MTSHAERKDRTRLHVVARLACALLISAFVMAERGHAADLPIPERAPASKPQTEPKPSPPAVKPEAAPPPKAERDDFGRLDANCIEANDGCRNYLRAADGQFDPVNNIGIACQPKAPVCTKTK
jgi:hypothetical protein